MLISQNVHPELSIHMDRASEPRSIYPQKSQAQPPVLPCPLGGTKKFDRGSHEKRASFLIFRLRISSCKLVPPRLPPCSVDLERRINVKLAIVKPGFTLPPGRFNGKASCFHKGSHQSPPKLVGFATMNEEPWRRGAKIQ